MATTSKNGYEIRSDLLGLAKSLVEFNYQAQIQEFEYKIKKDGDQVVQEFKAPTLAATDIINIAKPPIDTAIIIIKVLSVLVATAGTTVGN